MAKQAGKKRMTLSEHLAQRAKEAEQARLREQAYRRRMNTLEALDKGVSCTCPACVRRRQARQSASGDAMSGQT